VVSSRWSYGPDGLREREVEHAPLWPRWRELQPVLLRSAGIVGLVATIMAVVSSDALRLGGSEEPSALAAVDRNNPPVVVPASELPTASAAAGPEAAPLEQAAVASAPEAKAPEPAPEVQSSMPAPIVVTSVSIAPDTVPQAPSEPDITGLIKAEAAASEPPVQPAATAAAAGDPAAEEPQAAEDASPSTTASVASGPEVLASLAPDAVHEPAAAISISPLRRQDPLAGSSERSSWPSDAANCSRDWVEAEGSRDDGDADCASLDTLFAAVAPEEQSALEDAAAEMATTVIAALPRVPLPRPEPPADFKPSKPHKKTVRVNSQNPNWPPEPPPNCGAGKHAKWRFSDRKSGAKEWYCR
jgi:hypothetical protein